MEEEKLLQLALKNYIRWFGRRRLPTDELAEIYKQDRGVVLAMLLQEELERCQEETR
jgi:hypothetical protein